MVICNFFLIICNLFNEFVWFLDGTPIDTDLKRSALSLQRSLKWDDKAPELAAAIGGEVNINKYL